MTLKTSVKCYNHIETVDKMRALGFFGSWGEGLLFPESWGVLVINLGELRSHKNEENNVSDMGRLEHY